MIEKKAREAAIRGRVVRVILSNGEIEHYVVETKDRRGYYLIIPGLFCSCNDFLFNVILRKRYEKCYHLLAFHFAKEHELIRTLTVKEKGMYRYFLKKILYGLLY